MVIQTVNNDDKTPQQVLDEYFESVKVSGNECQQILSNNFKKDICCECGSKKRLLVHHLKYPATSINDLQVLCGRCHIKKHWKGINHKQQSEICEKYLTGINRFVLARDYSVSVRNISYVLREAGIATIVN